MSILGEGGCTRGVGHITKFVSTRSDQCATKQCSSTILHHLGQSTVASKSVGRCRVVLLPSLLSVGQLGRASRYNTTVFVLCYLIDVQGGERASIDAILGE